MLSLPLNSPIWAVSKDVIKEEKIVKDIKCKIEQCALKKKKEVNMCMSTCCAQTQKPGKECSRDKICDS